MPSVITLSFIMLIVTYKHFVLSVIMLSVVAPSSGLYYKYFTIVIYDRNGNVLYYKTTILANLA